VPVAHRLERGADRQQRRLVMRPADELQADRQPLCEAAGQREGW
jgi:hypothetical protein